MSGLSATVTELKHHCESILDLCNKIKKSLHDNKKPVVTLEQVRAVLAEKSRSGHTEEIRELLIKHGADRLSEIDPEKYSLLLKGAEGLVDV